MIRSCHRVTVALPIVQMFVGRRDQHTCPQQDDDSHSVGALMDDTCRSAPCCLCIHSTVPRLRGAAMVNSRCHRPKAKHSCAVPCRAVKASTDRDSSITTPCGIACHCSCPSATYNMQRTPCDNMQHATNTMQQHATCNVHHSTACNMQHDMQRSNVHHARCNMSALYTMQHATCVLLQLSVSAIHRRL